MPRPKKRRGFNRRGGLPERPHRLPQPIKAKGPTLIRHDYGYRDGRPYGMSAIAEFDADRRRNPRPNPIIREANRRAFRPELQYENGGPVSRSDSNTLGTGNVPFSMLSREGQAYKNRLAEARNAAFDRAQREMGYEGGPITPLLEELGMTENEFYDKVYDRMAELMLEPLEIRGPERVDSGYSRPQMRGEGERTMAREARGGMGASATEDLLERLSQYKRNAYGNKYEQGGEVKKKGSTIKIAGQYAYEPIATTKSGEQYVTMELPDGTMATVFGDWETYGNPSQEGYIEDLDYIIYPLGDGTYALDAAEAETEMLREESREVSRQAGTEVEDLLQELNQRGGMGFTPSGRMRPIKRQR